MSAISFVQRRDPHTGVVEWEAVRDGDDETTAKTSAVAVLHNTTYLDMLNDAARNEAYAVGIASTVKAGDRVLDIGTGTGLLALMAADAAGPSGRVDACESFVPMANAARRIVRRHRSKKTSCSSESGSNAKSSAADIHIHAKRGDELTIRCDARADGDGDAHTGEGAPPASCDSPTDMSHRADVCVTELFDSALLGEGVLAALADARQRLLTPGARYDDTRVLVAI